MENFKSFASLGMKKVSRNSTEEAGIYKEKMISFEKEVRIVKAKSIKMSANSHLSAAKVVLK